MTLANERTGRRTHPPSCHRSRVRASKQRSEPSGPRRPNSVPVCSARVVKGVSEGKPPRLYIVSRLRRARRPDRRPDRTGCQQKLTRTTAPTTNCPPRPRPATAQRPRQLDAPTRSMRTPTSRSPRSPQRTAVARSGVTKKMLSWRSLSTATGLAWSVPATRSTSSAGKRGDTVEWTTAPPSCDYAPSTPARSGWVGDTYKLHVGFKSYSRQEHGRTNAKLSTKGLREGRGGRFHPEGLVTYAFSRLRCKSTAASIAASLYNGAGVARRRVSSERDSTMNPDNSDDNENESEAQAVSSLLSDRASPPSASTTVVIL